MFRLEGVSKKYGVATALAPTDLLVERGQTVVLIGPSGSGKSTLLRLMAGLIPTDSGRVIFDGEELRSDARPEIRRRLGLVVQGGGLFPHLSAEGNACLVARYLAWPEPRIQGRLRELADITKFPLAGLARFPAQLSGGECQRVSLIRGLMLDPDAVLMDEPLGALDPITRFDLQADLRQIFERLGKTVVLVTHDLAEAQFFANRIVLLRGGRIIQQGTVDQLIQSPVDPFVTHFVRAQRALPAAQGPGAQ